MSLVCDGGSGRGRVSSSSSLSSSYVIYSDDI